jgi:hypothetical protein
VIRTLAVLAALIAALAVAPRALAATYVVNDNADTADADTAVDPDCDTDTNPGNGLDCTLRAAIQQANATAGADTITFTTGGESPAVAAPLDQVTGQLSIDGGGDTTVTFAPAATGALLDLEASNSVVKAITFTGGNAASTLVNLGASGDRLDTVTINGTSATPGTGIRLSGSSERVDNSRVTDGVTGIRIDGGSATISSPTITGTADKAIDIHGSAASVTNPEISGAEGDAVALAGNSANVSGGHIHDNGGNGVSIGGQLDVVSRVTFYGNGAKPISLASGANAGIAPPQNLRIGPRRSDGTLPLTGTGSAGTVELWAGDPATANVPSMVDSFRIGGDFTYNFASEPQPGQIFAASLTGDNLGTSEFTTVRVPDDISSPDASFARALDTNDVSVQFTEPIDPGSIQSNDFHLNMAGVDRQISGFTVAPDGRSATLSVAGLGWKAGEAGFLEITAAGAVADPAGNAMTTTPRLRVAAAPGDFIAPLGGSLAVSPRTICLTHGRNCRKPGMTIKFTTTEPGKATLMIKRGDVTLGKRLYGNIIAGKNTLKFNGRLGARKLRAGRYRLLMWVQDQVGNVTDQPPIVLFSVRRTTK